MRNGKRTLPGRMHNRMVIGGAAIEAAQTGATYRHHQEGLSNNRRTTNSMHMRACPEAHPALVASCVSPTWVRGRVRRPGPSVVLDLPPTRRGRLAALPPILQSVPSLWSPLLNCPGPGHSRPAAAARPFHPFPDSSIRGPLSSGKSIQAWRDNRA
jgi:hypothetical protein